MGTCRRSWKFFQSIMGLQYAICDDLWLCSVEYSACVSGFWPPDPTGALPLDPLGDLPPLSPLSKFLATPLSTVNIMYAVTILYSCCCASRMNNDDDGLRLTACFVKKLVDANSDGAQLLGILSEQACAQACLDRYPDCLAADYRTSDQSCYGHNVRYGTQWNNCCNRYQIICSGAIQYNTTQNIYNAHKVE